MSKTAFQIINFLDQYEFKSEMDWKGICSFCKAEHDIVFELQPNFSNEGLTFAIFAEWYEGGFAPGDIVRYNENIALIGNCNLDGTTIEATVIESDLDLKKHAVKTNQLSKASDEEREILNRLLVANKLQFNEQGNTISDRYIPEQNHRVRFSKDGITGVGVIRSVNIAEDCFEMYCYYIYENQEIGYSMHETLPNFNVYKFQIMSINEYGKLKRELAKSGKIWNDRMHRVEPIEYRVKAGEKYWYISDKMSMVSDIENDRLVPKKRYWVGNYFRTPQECLKAIDAILEILADNLAK